MKIIDKIQIILLLFCWFELRLHAQTVWDPSVYHSISSEEKIAIFFDDFDDNRYNWGLGEEINNWCEKLEQGNLFFQSFDNNAKEDLISFPIDENKDFEIETSIRFIQGDTLKFFGLQWGKSSSAPPS